MKEIGNQNFKELFKKGILKKEFEDRTLENSNFGELFENENLFWKKIKIKINFDKKKIKKIKKNK